MPILALGHVICITRPREISNADSGSTSLKSQSFKFLEKWRCHFTSFPVCLAYYKQEGKKSWIERWKVFVHSNLIKVMPLHQRWLGSIGKCALMPRAALQIMHSSVVTHSYQCSPRFARAALGMRYSRFVHYLQCSPRHSSAFPNTPSPSLM